MANNQNAKDAQLVKHGARLLVSLGYDAAPGEAIPREIVLADWPEIHLECRAMSADLPWHKKPAGWLADACEAAASKAAPTVSRAGVLVRVQGGPWALIQPFNGWVRTGAEEPSWHFGQAAVARAILDMTLSVKRRRDGATSYADSVGNSIEASA